MVDSYLTSDLLSVFNSDSISNDTKFENIQILKTHIKKDSIDLLKVPIYLQIIMKGLELNDSRITSVSFNSLSYLIKRISVQDKSGKVLKDQSFLILPILINKLGSSNTSVAKKALEDYWLSSPNEVEKALNEISFNTSNKQLFVESIRWIIQIVQDISKKFNIAYFIPDIIRTVSNKLNDEDIIGTVNNLIEIFIQNNDTGAVQYLQDQYSLFNLPNDGTFITQNISKPKSATTSLSSNQPIKISKSKYKAAPMEDIQKPKQQDEVSSQSFESKLSELLSKNKYDLEVSIAPKDVLDHNELYKIFETYSNHFEGKETESNWKLREKSIVEVRSLVRGSASIKFSSELIQCLKAFAISLCKGANSLRTTLCTHSCQLIKECAIILETEFDACAELIFPTLMKQCLSTKNITSSNANMAVAALFANLPYNPRLLNRVSSSMIERNHQPRLFSALWLQILLLRYSMNNSFFGNHLTQVIDVSNKLLIKLLKDANPNVRQTAKDCYWCYSQILPEESEKLVKRLDQNTVKALERSQRSSRIQTNAAVRSSRPSMRETISSKHRDSRMERPSSRAESRESSQNSIALSLPKRNHRVDSNPPQFVTRPTPRASSLNPQPKQNNTIDRARSRTEVLKASPLENEESYPELSKPEFKEPPKNKQDVMIEYFASKDADIIYEAIDMLITAIHAKEAFVNSYALKSKLRYISEKDPFLLKQLFPSTNNELFKKSSKLFSIEDFNRTCFILFNDIDQNTIDLICSCFEISELIDTYLRLLNYIIDYPNIPGNNNFKLQILNYQFKIAQSCLQALSIIFIKTPISDVQFGDIFNVSVSLIMVLKQHQKSFYLLKQLFCQLYSNDCNKFLQLLDDIEFNLKDEVESIVGIDNNVMMIIDKPLDDSVFEMTEINPGKIGKFEVDGVINGGFTMVVPNKFPNFEHNSDVERIEEDEQLEDNPVNESFKETSFEGKPFKLVKQRTSNHKDEHEEQTLAEPSDSIKLKNPKSLIDEFSQINIAPPPYDSHSHYNHNPIKSPTMESLQTMIEKVDPLNPISNKIRKISIYEDSDSSRTNDTKHINHHSELKNNHQEWNWENITYNINSFKCSSYNIGSISTIDQFNSACEKLCKFIITNQDEEEEINRLILNLSSTLESLTTTNYEFREYFLKDGKYKLSNSLFLFLKDFTIINQTNGNGGIQNHKVEQHQEQNVLDLLYLLKLILKYDELIDLDQVWNLLKKLNSLLKIENQLYYAWIEILKQINLNNNLNLKMYEIIINELEILSTSDATTNPIISNQQTSQVIIINLSLIYLTNFINDLKILNYQDQINFKKLDNLISNFFKSENIYLRKNSIICYSKIFKHVPMFNSENSQMLLQLKNKYSISQQRLIEFYSQK
ncbi:STU1 [Candida pseudojiufengensis]|uniref:STU1 n=1 Tax=Candida pseudojiufengensis TaxID=497109 RepID=UPI002224CFEF|nr:STU1 [Candida pseudojiufengensis]KAI5960590.1 STU1 [Candida pseudojiufengensis]